MTSLFGDVPRRTAVQAMFLLGGLFLLELGPACSDSTLAVDTGLPSDVRPALEVGRSDGGTTPQGDLRSGGEGSAGNVCEPSAALLSRIDEARMLEDFKFLVGLGERRSLEGQRQAAGYLKQQLEKIPGLQVTEHRYTYLGQSYVNLEATLRGSEAPDQFVFASAHYDSTSSDWNHAPGADDNGSGTVAVLETARAFAGCKVRQSVRFIFFSNEEKGRIGSTAYVKDLAGTLPPQRLTGLINLDMVGYAKDGEDLDLATKPVYGSFVEDTKAAMERWISLKIKAVINDQCG
jgi:hypothetical protein